MNGPLGGFVDDDGASINLNMEGRSGRRPGVTPRSSVRATSPNADDADAYVGRVGVNVTKELRVTLEGMILDEKSMAGQDFGDTFWVGATVGAKIGDIQLDGAVVYGQRSFAPADCGGGLRAPVRGERIRRLRDSPGCRSVPVSVNALGWYTSGDDQVGPGGSGSAAGTASRVRMLATLRSGYPG